MPDAAADRRHVAAAPCAARPGRAPGPADARTASHIRHDHHRRRPGRPRGGGLWRVRRAAHRGGRARGARRPGRYVLAHRELPGLSSGVSGDELASRALQQARRLGAEILVTRSVARVDPASREVCLDSDEIVHGRTIILATGVTWRRLAIAGFDRLIGKGILLRRSTQRSERHAQARRPPHRRRKFGRAGGLVLCRSRAHGDAGRAWEFAG